MPLPRSLVATGLSSLGVAALLALASCSSEGPATPSDPVLAEGQDIYERQCATCHGVDGGGGLGSPLEGIEDRLDLDAHIAVIVEGRPGTNMPAFEDRLTADQIEAVARYEREVL